MKIKINQLIGKLEIHCHGGKKVNTSDIGEQIKRILSELVNKAIFEKEGYDRKIVIEQDFFVQKEGDIRKIETVYTKITENGELILEQEQLEECYMKSDLKKAIDSLTRGHNSSEASSNVSSNSSEC